MSQLSISKLKNWPLLSSFILADAGKCSARDLRGPKPHEHQGACACSAYGAAAGRGRVSRASFSFHVFQTSVVIQLIIYRACMCSASAYPKQKLMMTQFELDTIFKTTKRLRRFQVVHILAVTWTSVQGTQVLT